VEFLAEEQVKGGDDDDPTPEPKHGTEDAGQGGHEK
jgi:hypothetical protein